MKQVLSVIGFVVSLSLISLAQSQPNSQTANTADTTGKPPDAIPLATGKIIERKLSGGQTHMYQIALTEGQYLEVTVEQRGIDVAVRLLGPDGKLITEFDSELRKQGQETVVQVAENSGNYQMEVRAKEKAATAASYEIRVVERREAGEKDRALQEARKLSAEVIRLFNAGKYDEAQPLAERVLEIREKAHGLEHLEVARALSNLANLYRGKGNHAKAEPLYLRALTIREKSLGVEHPDVALLLNNLAILYTGTSNYAKAEPLFLRALTIREKALGQDHLEVARSLNNLALHYTGTGDYAKARPLYLRALAIIEKMLGPEHPDVAMPLNNLGNLYSTLGDYSRAAPLLERAQAIREKMLGPDHREVGRSLNNLANLYRDKGDYAKAVSFYQRAVTIYEKSLGPDHLDVAGSLNNLAIVYRDKGDYAKAEPLLLRALTIREKTLGPEHPDVAQSLNSFARLSVARGALLEAVAFQSRASIISERNLALNLATGSERQKLAYLATLSSQADQTISLHVRSTPTDPTARSLAITTILQRKGRILDAVTDSFSGLHRRFNPQDQSLLDLWKNHSAQLARLVLGGPQKISLAEHQKQIKALEEKKDQLEAEISRHSAEFRAQFQPITLGVVQTAIPTGGALIEFASYRPFNPKYAKPDEQFGQPHYVAYVLRHEGQTQWIELGTAKSIDDSVAALRQALRDPRHPDVERLARQVDEQVMRPVRGLLGNTRHLLISPDGSLNLVPFAALVDERGRFLLENYSFTYLTSGRDLLRLRERIPSKQRPLVVASPQFDEAGTVLASGQLSKQEESQTVEARRSLDVTTMNFRALPGTTSEAAVLSKLLPQAKILTGRQASESALKGISGPEILHIATHGFFLSDQKAESRAGDVSKMGLPENPLLRSGLVLSGANQRQGGSGEDGILTALEAAGLDLWGTKLVVLSACETGVGDVRNGEGVYGLRRAMVLAGAESQVMSLWQVSDDATRDLMAAYYKRLLAGEGRGEALRQVQLKMLSDFKKARGTERGVKKIGDSGKAVWARRSHPYYWASFIQSGEWANLAGKR